MCDAALGLVFWQGVIDNAERFVKHVVKHALETCPDDLASVPFLFLLLACRGPRMA